MKMEDHFKVIEPGASWRQWQRRKYLVLERGLVEANVVQVRVWKGRNLSQI